MEETTTTQSVQQTTEAAYRRGRQTGLAIGALAMSVVSFISLLGIEKAILAAVLGVLSLRGMPRGTSGRRYGTGALTICLAYVITFVIVLVVFYDRFVELIRLLQQLD